MAGIWVKKKVNFTQNSDHSEPEYSVLQGNKVFRLVPLTLRLRTTALQTVGTVSPPFTLYFPWNAKRAEPSSCCYTTRIKEVDTDRTHDTVKEKPPAEESCGLRRKRHRLSCSKLLQKRGITRPVSSLSSSAQRRSVWCGFLQITRPVSAARTQINMHTLCSLCCLWLKVLAAGTAVCCWKHWWYLEMLTWQNIILVVWTWKVGDLPLKHDQFHWVLIDYT